MRRWILGVALAAGCGDGEPLRAPRVVSTTFSAGAVSPTATLAVLLSAPIDGPSVEGNVYLARGEPEPALERPPPPVRARERLVPGGLVLVGDRLEFTPRRALDPDSRYTLYLGPKLVAGGQRLGKPVALAVDTGGLDRAAPIVILDAPADGAVDVPRNLRAVRLHFSRPVSNPLEVALADDAGAPLASRASADGDGVRLDLEAPFDAGAHYQVRAGPDVADAEGRAVFGDPPGFMAGGELRSGAVVLHALDAPASDRCVVVRFATDEPTWSEVCVADRCAVDGPLRAHEAVLAFGGALDGSPLGLRARAWDETTRPAADQRSTVAAPAALALSLTEVLTRPLGPRTRQQFVELYNSGAQAIDLGALSLHTASGSNALPSLLLPPGGYAVVVPSGYTPGAGGDPAPAAGALLVRLDDARLGGRGIKVAGEPVWIEDTQARVVSRWGGYPLALQPGQSVTRAPGSCDVAASFQPTPSGGSTPGGP